MNATTGIIVAVVLVGGAGMAIYFGSRSKPPITQVMQQPSAAVAGINALGALAAKGFDSYLKYRASEKQVSKTESEEV
jgi:hypothetical protein